jgi:hypothetical protein
MVFLHILLSAARRRSECREPFVDHYSNYSRGTCLSTVPSALTSFFLNKDLAGMRSFFLPNPAVRVYDKREHQ